MRGPVRPGPARRPRSRHRILRGLTGWGFSLPAFGLMAVFVGAPVVYGAWLSLHSWSGFNTPVFVGVQNFVGLFAQDPLFVRAMGNSLAYSAIAVIGRNVLGLAFALLLIRLGRRSQVAARVAVFLPATMSLVAVGALWVWMYNPSSGFINSLLGALGLDALQRTWLGDPSTALVAVALVDVWWWVGFHALLYYVGLQSLPGDVLEAARVDGAGPFSTLFRITLPLLSPVILVNLILSLSGTFVRNFDTVYVMTQGGPNHATEVVLTHMVTQAFGFGKLGYATAIGLVLFVTMILALFLVTRLMRRWTDDVSY